MTTAALIYPHQLFAKHPALEGAALAVVVEDPLFFSQYRFHRQKLILHRASMKHYASRLDEPVEYVDAAELENSGSIAPLLKRWKVERVQYVDPCDDWLSRRLTAGLEKAGIASTVLDDPHFLTSRSEIQEYTKGKAKLFAADFYIQQRRRLGILLEDRASPVGGKWSFDTENRKKLPKGLKPPRPRWPTESPEIQEARQYVRKAFPDAVGDDEPFRYPTIHAASKGWLKEFIADRLESFGDYEDAISTGEQLLFHSLLTPVLNTGLLSPREAVDAALSAADRIPMNSLEGFIRQVIGWREFVRMVYYKRGRKQRIGNFWKHTQPMPRACYDGTTGIDPVDRVIRNVLRTGYCHHIERLMILGNFFLLCEIDPKAVYQWFMELFIDAYDWVMVPNVYGMSQYADGGSMTTKPYISGSSYVLKMSDEKRGDWCPVWDALYWNFVAKHKQVFAANPRMAMMAKMCEKLGDKLTEHQKRAKEFLAKLHAK
jgi:deoxyribodipyrimidine photolyase-related protein